MSLRSEKDSLHSRGFLNSWPLSREEKREGRVGMSLVRFNRASNQVLNGGADLRVEEDNQSPSYGSLRTWR